MPAQKKGPQGSCAECGAVIPKRLRYCDACKRLKAERERKEKEGIVVVRTPSGTVEVKAAHVHLHRELVFLFNRFGGDILSPSATLGAFVDILYGALRAKPGYLLEADIHRHLAMLYQFSQYKMPEFVRGGPQLVTQLPLSDLDFGLLWWVDSYLQPRNGESSHHPLMSTYAIDTAEFVRAHAFGGRPDTKGPIAVIAPIFPQPLADQRGENFLNDQQFKRRITEDIGRTLALVKVPPQGRCIAPPSGTAHIPGGASFLFEIQRCHLSSGFNDMAHLLAVDDAEPPIYLSRDFRFYGRVIVPSRGRDFRIIGELPAELEASFGADASTDNASMNVPVRWISHVLEYKDYDQDISLVPVPEWAPDAT